MNKRIDFLNLVFDSDLNEKIKKTIGDVIDEGWFVKGRYLDKFESSFADYTNSKYCVGVANGLDAIQIALKAIGVGPGDEVIVPGFTFIATWLAVSNIGATPIPVDIDYETCNIDPRLIPQVVTKKTKAILPVHLFGQSAEMLSICDLANEYNLAVIEDAAQAHGAKHYQRELGSFGVASAFSFYPGKNLGCLGDGGAVTTNSSQISSYVRSFANYGSKKKYEHTDVGVNSRLDELQAAVLSLKLNELTRWNSIRKKQAELYLEQIKNEELDLPVVKPYNDHVWHLFTVKSKKREDIMKYLESRGVQTQIHYPLPPHKQICYKSTYGDCSLPISEDVSKKIFSLPIGPHLTESQILFVSELINNYKG